MPASKLISLSMVAALSIGLCIGASHAQQTQSEADKGFNREGIAALESYHRNPAASAQRIGIAMLRAGHYREAERWMRRAIRANGELLEGAEIAALTNAEVEHIKNAISARNPSALFAAGAMMFWQGEGSLGADSLSLYEMVIGGDSDIQILFGADFRRTLMRADAHAEAERYDAARAELGLALAAEPHLAIAKGRLAAHYLATGNFERSEPALREILIGVPAGQTFHTLLPAAKSGWWRRHELLGIEADQKKHLSSILHAALIGNTASASAQINALAEGNAPPELSELSLKQLEFLRVFVATCVPLPSLHDDPSEIRKRWQSKLADGEYAEVAKFLTAAYKENKDPALLGPLALTNLAIARRADDATPLAGIAGALRLWGKHFEDVPPEELREMLPEGEVAAIVDWLARAEQGPDHLLLRFTMGDSSLDIETLIAASQAESLVRRWLPKDQVEAYENSLPDPQKAPKHLSAGNAFFAAGKYAQAHAEYILAGRNDATLSGLPEAMFRSSVATKAYQEAVAFLTTTLSGTSFAEAVDARRYSLGMRDLASKSQITRWEERATDFANLKPADWDRVLLVAMLAWEAQDWGRANAMFEVYLESAPEKDALSAVKMLHEAAQFFVKE